MTSAPPAAASREVNISIVIPAVNEAENLSETIAAIVSKTVSFELIVVDAASSDATAHLAEMSGAHVIRNYRRQRAHQLNLGVRYATGQTILFLHADTILPANALERIANAMKRPDVVGGGFTRRLRCFYGSRVFSHVSGIT